MIGRRPQWNRRTCGKKEHGLPPISQETKAAISRAFDRLEGTTPEQRRRNFARRRFSPKATTQG